MQINDVGLKKGDGGLLRLARDKLIARGIMCVPEGNLVDTHGTYAYRFLGLLLVAKKRVYGNIVSVHANVVQVAKKERRCILMYLGETGNYYVFNPHEIEAAAEGNRRDNVKMLNFPIRLGRNMDTYEEEIRKPRQKTLFEGAI